MIQVSTKVEKIFVQSIFIACCVRASIAVTRMIQNSLIFYFAEFLSKATSVASQQTEWNANVRRAAVTTWSSMSQTQSLRFGRGSIPIPFTISLANEIQFCTTAYATTKQARLLGLLTQTVNVADPNLQPRSPRSNVPPS